MMKILHAFPVILMFLACSCAWPVNLVTEDDPPHNMVKDKKIVGISTEKLEEAFRRVGSIPQITLMPWARAYQSALNTADVCAYSTARTAERENLFQWVGPISMIDWVLYARSDLQPKPTSLEDVRKERIGGYLQDVISVWLADNGYHVDTAQNDDANPQKLMYKRFNYWASSRSRAAALIDKQGLGEQIVPVLTFGHTDLYLACNKRMQSDLVIKLNEALHQMNADGTSANIEAHYAIR